MVIPPFAAILDGHEKKPVHTQRIIDYIIAKQPPLGYNKTLIFYNNFST